jgi:hypothetical protein
MSARRHFWRGTPPCFCVCRGNIRLTAKCRVSRGIVGLRRILAGSRERRQAKRGKSPREHVEFSHVMASSSTVFHSTETILRPNGNGSDQENGKREIKTRTLENREDAAPKTALTVDLSPTRHFEHIRHGTRGRPVPSPLRARYQCSRLFPLLSS